MGLVDELRERFGAEVVVDDDRIIVKVGARSFSLADLSEDSLKEIMNFNEIVVVEERRGRISYYYFRPGDVELLLRLRKRGD